MLGLLVLNFITLFLIKIQYMKKITFILILLSIGLQAQTFPSPYCDIDPTGTTVEEITMVNFAGSSITNADVSSILVDETATVVNVEANETYTIEVQGNTEGNFDNDIVAFIDWNQNEILDDADEVYEIGTLTNSTGADGILVSMNITVPSDVLTGETRIRITKTYGDADSPAIINPCAIEMDAFGQGPFPGYGQGLDFTLNVENLSTEQFDTNALSVYPIPTQDVLNINYSSELQTVKVFSLLGQEVYSENPAAQDVQLNLSSLSPGLYMVQLFTEQAQHSFRLIKE